jgi:hypothetical protein
MSSQVHRHPENFRIATSILLDIKKNNGKLDGDFGLDKDLLKLWVYTLVGTGRIRKDGSVYAITEKGEEELRQHGCEMLVAG